jgi:hypothetical protein
MESCEGVTNCSIVINDPTDVLGSSGDIRTVVESFRTSDIAQAIADYSIANNVEVAFEIVQVEVGVETVGSREVSILENRVTDVITTGQPDSVNVSGIERPAGTVRALIDGHSHGAGGGAAAQEFSGTDTDAYRERAVVGMVVTPEREIKIYNPFIRDSFQRETTHGSIPGG